MSLIQIDVESNKSDLDTLVESANTKIGELQGILSQITAFQLTFSVTEVPSATSPDTTEPDTTSDQSITEPPTE